MTNQGKTLKEQKAQQEQHERWKLQREGKKEEKLKGGHRNLLREAAEELEEETSND
jgi:hypothetical protein